MKYLLCDRLKFMDNDIGLKRNTLRLIPHNPRWKNIYNEEKARILKGIKDHIISIEHIGSTAINNIYSKPIIDICISLRKYDDGFKCVEYLESTGYLYKGEFGVKGRHFFRTADEIVKFHIHMYEADSVNYRDHINFRDYLNKYPGEAGKYGKLKLMLKKTCRDDRDSYTKKKESFIKKIIKKAEKEFRKTG